MERPTCPYCNRPAQRRAGRDVYPDRRALRDRWFYVCKPCDARVGTHDDGTTPLGTLANAALRVARSRAHALFDPLWQGSRWPQLARRGAYVWLASEFGGEFHIGTATPEQLRALSAMLTFGDEVPSVDELEELGADDAYNPGADYVPDWLDGWGSGGADF